MTEREQKVLKIRARMAQIHEENALNKKHMPTRESSSDETAQTAIVMATPSRLAFLNRPTCSEAWVLKKLTNLETHCHVRMRCESFPRRMFALSLIPLSALAACTSLLLSQTTSMGEANAVCKTRNLVVLPQLGHNGEFLENGSQVELMPGIFFNVISLVVSLVGLLGWLYFSPHQRSDQAAPLDRKLGSFFGFQYLGSLLTVVIYNVFCCTSSKMTHVVASFLYMVAVFGISLLGTNILCHRYLLERAAIMNTINVTNAVDTQVTGWFSLEALNASFIWEIRTLVIAGSIMVVYLFDSHVAFGAGAVIWTIVLLTDAVFSVIVTYLFLKPILEVLQVAGGVQTAASRRLERIRRWNFAGVFVTVGSSTALYVNLVVYFVLIFLRRYSINRGLWGNPFTFGLAADSILNTLGMLLLCGMFKDVALSLSLPRLPSATANNKVVAAAIVPAQNGILGRSEQRAADPREPHDNWNSI